ncbi:DUF1702 family protein [Pseudonocardia zijingensis]|uniref:DUF1702 family protein n=1 Tax=Pseudonocardia zijingensis TaxID=153376 RepID=UPI0036097FD7
MVRSAGQPVADCRSATKISARSSEGDRVLRVRKTLFGIDATQTRFEARGFDACEPDVQSHLEGHAAAFVDGYNAALVQDDELLLDAELQRRVAADRRGFAFEGAAMAYTLLDALPLPGRGRFSRLLAGPGAHEPFLIHAGAGWAYARLRRRTWPTTALDPLLQWLHYDGYGFHQVFFARGAVQHVHGARSWDAYGHRAFHQGVGRALWFRCGADPDRIATTVRRFSAHLAADLWSGVGLAATYAGGGPDAALATLAGLSGGQRPALAQGAVAATAARVTARNANSDTERGCAQLCGLTVDEAHALYEKSLDGLVPQEDPMAYETWRTRVQHHFRETGR